MNALIIDFDNTLEVIGLLSLLHIVDIIWHETFFVVWFD